MIFYVVKLHGAGSRLNDFPGEAGKCRGNILSPEKDPQCLVNFLAHNEHLRAIISKYYKGGIIILLT